MPTKQTKNDRATTRSPEKSAAADSTAQNNGQKRAKSGRRTSRRGKSNRAKGQSGTSAQGKPKAAPKPMPASLAKPGSNASSSVPANRQRSKQGRGAGRPEETSRSSQNGSRTTDSGRGRSGQGGRAASSGSRPSAGAARGQRSGSGGGQRSGSGGGQRRGSGGGQRRGSGGGQRRRKGSGQNRRPRGRQSEHRVAPEKKGAPTPEVVTEVVIPEQITVRDLADKMLRSPIEIIKTLMNYGIMVPITQTIDFGTAQVVGEELGIMVKPEAPPEPEVQEEEKQAPLTLRQHILASENPDELVTRPPIVTVLGHVDHGKTTLLDAIRETRVVDGEAGGITQHIGAYQVESRGRKITFLDTPGHEAFTAMRARGAMVTDIAVLVVAADDGVMPQTKEAIAHARAAQVPILVALNKIDKDNANPNRVKQELADNDLLIEEYGGDVICTPVSAKFRQGIEDVLESILLVAEIDPLKANPNGACIGTVIESRLDKTRGPTATLLVQNGTLRVGDSVVSGETHGKIRAMYDDNGAPINEARPSTPVIVLGMSEVPEAGNTFEVVADERTARNIASQRYEEKRAASTSATPSAMNLETIFAQAQAGQAKALNLILKADVQGSIEPIVNSLEKLGDEKLHVKILQEATGNITESDVMLAMASQAIILGFSVSVDPAAQRMADTESVDIRIYDIIYKLIEDIQKALTGLLEPVYENVVTGHAEVRAVFRITKVGKIAGCYVTDGEIARNSLARLIRDGETIYEGRLSSLKRFQDDVAEVKTGFECGINLQDFSDFQEGDVVEAYKKVRAN